MRGKIAAVAICIFRVSCLVSILVMGCAKDSSRQTKAAISRKEAVMLPARPTSNTNTMMGPETTKGGDTINNYFWTFVQLNYTSSTTEKHNNVKANGSSVNSPVSGAGNEVSINGQQTGENGSNGQIVSQKGTSNLAYNTKQGSSNQLEPTNEAEKAMTSPFASLLASICENWIPILFWLFMGIMFAYAKKGFRTLKGARRLQALIIVYVVFCFTVYFIAGPGSDVAYRFAFAGLTPSGEITAKGPAALILFVFTFFASLLVGFLTSKALTKKRLREILKGAKGIYEAIRKRNFFLPIPKNLSHTQKANLLAFNSMHEQLAMSYPKHYVVIKERRLHDYDLNEEILLNRYKDDKDVIIEKVMIEIDGPFTVGGSLSGGSSDEKQR